MSEKFTIEEFRKYCESKDSMGDILYFLSEENVKKANKVKDPSELCEWEYIEENPMDPNEFHGYWKTSCGDTNKKLEEYCHFCGKDIKVIGE